MMGRTTANRALFAVFLTAFLTVLAGCDQTGGGAAPEAAQSTEPASTPAGGEVSLDDDIAKASYSLGFTQAENLVGNFADGLDQAAFLKGLEDGFAGAERAISEEEARASLAALAAAQQQALAGRATANLDAGRRFLEENGAREGVTTLPSGLQYEVLTAAEGDTPAATDTVTTHYHGTLIDGTVFDSSYDRGEPASFPLNGVIAGWTEALQLMAVGAKWRLYIPPELAYGEQDRGRIPANSTLIFDVELLEIN